MLAASNTRTERSRKMATKGGEERKRKAVPVAVVTGASCFIGSWIINHATTILASPHLLQGFVSAVALAILLEVQDYHHICQAVASRSDIINALMARSSLISGVETMLMLMLALLFSRWWSRVFSIIALLMVIVLVEQSVRLVHVALSGSCYYFGGDIVKAAVVVALIVVGQLALSFWSAKVMVSFDPYRSDDQEQSKRLL